MRRAPVIVLLAGVASCASPPQALVQPPPAVAPPSAVVTPTAVSLLPPAGVVLVTLDTTRRDHLPFYGYFRPTTPFLDRLAQRGLVYDRAIASSSTTLPAHAALFTGRYPSEIGVQDNDGLLATEVRTLAAVFREGGYQTAAFASVGFLRAITVGFDEVDIPPPDGANYRPAEDTVAAAVHWLEQRPREKPWFLWVHLFDAHEPSQALRLDRAGWLGGMARGDNWFRQQFHVPARFAPGPEVGLGSSLSVLMDAYDAQLLRMDRALEGLERGIDAGGGRGSTVWVITADHGQGLGSHGYYGHGKHLYNEQIHVPLLVVDPSEAPRRIQALVEHVDIYSALLRRSSLSPSSGVEGGLAGWGGVQERDGVAHSERRSFSGAVPPDADGTVVAHQDRRWKYIDRENGEDEVYDIATDPSELRDLGPKLSPTVADRLFRSPGFQSVPNRAPAERATPDVRRQLTALGYLEEVDRSAPTATEAKQGEQR